MALYLDNPVVSDASAFTAPASATEAYNTWLLELGATDTLNAANGDDWLYVFDGVAFDANATTVRTFWDTEGGLGLFYEPPQSESKIGSPAYGFQPSTRNYGTASPPNFLVRCSGLDSSDHATTGSRQAASGSTFIFFGHIAQFNNAASSAVEVAFRVQPGLIDIVATNISSTNACIYAYPFIKEKFITIAVALAFQGTVAYTLTHSRLHQPIAIQPLTPYGPPLAKYNPAIGKPVMQAITPDLTDRLPYGIPNTPIVDNVNPWEFKGRGRITGTVKNTPNIPVYRLLRLYREPGGLLVKSVWSDPVTGEYTFDGIPLDYRYTVVSYDHTEAFRAVIADRVLPEAIP